MKILIYRSCFIGFLTQACAKTTVLNGAWRRKGALALVSQVSRLLGLQQDTYLYLLYRVHRTLYNLPTIIMYDLLNLCVVFGNVLNALCKNTLQNVSATSTHLRCAVIFLIRLAFFVFFL